uniref:Selenoprotein S n=2 Tax=Lygus hesperus TaxID=30085 RepID=A0A0A9WU01_LYGHE
MEMEVEDEFLEIEGPSVPTSTMTKLLGIPFMIWNFASSILIAYGWYLFGLVVLYGAFRHKIEATYMKWRRRRDEFEYAAKYHKDSELARSRMEAVIAAREKMQREHELKAAEAERKRLEREEKKKAERAAALQDGVGPYRVGEASSASGASTSSKSLRADYFPLSGDTGSGGYKAPKKSCCKKGGGCG